MIQNGSATTLNFTKDSSNSQTVTLNNTQAYNGTTTITSGTFLMGSIGSSTGGFASTSSLNMTGGWLDLNQKTVSVANLYGTGGGLKSSNGRGTLILNDSGTNNLTGPDCGNNSNFVLWKQGSGTLTIGNFNTSSGLLKISGGTLKLTGTSNNPPVTVFGGGILEVNNNDSIGALTLGDSGGTAGTIQNTSGSGYTLYLNGGGSALTVPAGAATGNLISATNLTLNLNNTTQTMSVNGGDLTINAPITSGNLTKAGSGTLTLNGANTYGGTTSINGGTVLWNFDNSSCTGAVNISNAKLAGTGKVYGDVTVNASGALAPGGLTAPTGTQTLTLNGSLTLYGNSALDYFLGATGSTTINMTDSSKALNLPSSNPPVFVNVTADGTVGTTTYTLITTSSSAPAVTYMAPGVIPPGIQRRLRV